MNYMLAGRNENKQQLIGFVQERSKDLYIDDLKQLLGETLSALENVRDERSQMEFGEDFNLLEQVKQYEADIIRYALRLTKGNQKAAAKMLGINYTTLNIKVKRYNLADKVVEETAEV